MNALLNSDRTGSSLALRFLSMLLLAWTLAANPVAGQTNPPPVVPSNRFLFILDTSAAMKRKLPDTLKAVDKIIASGASGQLHNGDTIGLWTFNRDVYAEFPLQTWGDATPADLSKLVHRFMEHQHFTNTANLDKALREMFGVMSASDVITVVLVYGGEDIIRGTPFDVLISDYLKKNVKPARGKGVPLVVALESKGGTIVNYAVAASPWPIEFPPLPQPEPLPDLKPSPPPVVETVKPPAPVTPRPNLILSGPDHPATPSVQAQTVPITPAEKAASSPVVANTAPIMPPIPLPPPPPQTETVAQPTPAPSDIAPATISQTAAQPAPDSAPPAPKPAPVPLNQPAPTTVPLAQIPATHEADSIPASANSTTAEPNNPGLNSSPLANSILPAPRGPAGFLFAGLALAIVGAGLILLMLKRTRQKAGPSFISRSIADKK